MNYVAYIHDTSGEPLFSGPDEVKRLVGAFLEDIGERRGRVTLDVEGQGGVEPVVVISLKDAMILRDAIEARPPHGHARYDAMIEALERLDEVIGDEDEDEDEDD